MYPNLHPGGIGNHPRLGFKGLITLVPLLANEGDGWAMVVLNRNILHAIAKEKFQLYHEKLTGVTATNRK